MSQPSEAKAVERTIPCADSNGGRAEARPPVPRQPRGRVGRVPALATAVVLGLTLLTSACGGSSGAKVARVSTTGTGKGSGSSSASGKGDARAYSACMRSHGVPDFPDPDSSGHIKVTSGGDKSGHKTGVDVNSPQFRKAQQACQKLQPNGGRPSQQQSANEQQQALKFSACMRSHGVRKFPDPKFSPGGGSTMAMQGIDPNSPQFKAAQQACQKLVPGSPMGAEPAPGGTP